jgi:hypothetical protein
MTFYLHALSGLHCDDVGTATSPQVSSPGRMKNGELDFFLHKQNMVLEQVFQPLWRISLRFGQTYGLWAACIGRLRCALFRYFYSVFLLLGFVFQIFFFLLRQISLCVCCAILFGMFCIGLCDRQPSLGVLENHQAVSFVDTICTFFPYKSLSKVDGV